MFLTWIRKSNAAYGWLKYTSYSDMKNGGMALLMIFIKIKGCIVIDVASLSIGNAS